MAPVAVRVLLTRERPRYAEEYGSELWEIAQVGGYWRPAGWAHGARACPVDLRGSVV